MKAAFIFSLVVLGASIAFAQSVPDPGAIPAFSSVEAHQYENINLATLAIQLNVPIRSKAGHIPFNFRMQGNSQITYTVNIHAGGGQDVFFGATPKLAGGEPQGGGSIYWTKTLSCDVGQSNEYYDWVYVDPNGASHPTNIPALCPPLSGSGSGYTTDGSGTYVYLSGVGQGGYAIDMNGVKTTFVSAASSNAITDPNGNSITATKSGSTTWTYTDTLSQTALTNTTQQTLGTNPAETDTWTDAAGNQQSVVYNTATRTLATWFGCGWNTEGQTSTWYLPSTVNLPDSSSLTYTWETNYSNSSYYTGRIASIKLPQGGTISYAYSGGTHGVDCTDGMPVTVTRTTPDGVWTYTRSTNGSGNWVTTVNDPAGNKFVYTFTAISIPYVSESNPAQSDYLVSEKQSYTGSTQTQTVITCYNDPNSTPTSCNPASTYLPITEKDEYTTYPGMSGYSAVKTTYDSVSTDPTYGYVTDVKTYDFGLTLINEKKIQYGTGSAASQTCSQISAYITGKICSVTVLDSQHGNAIASQTWNTYDSNGNLTATSNLVSGSGSSGVYLTKQFTYNSSGVMQTATDVNGGVTNYTTTSCNNMFVTSQYTTGFSNLETSQTWDCNGGVVTSATDANGQTTQTVFDNSGTTDPFYRPVETIDELGNVTTLKYKPTTSESIFLFNGGQSVIDKLTTTDSIGRAAISQLRQLPGSTSFDTKSRTFDADGRSYETSLACVTTASTACSASTESQTYDALNRRLVHTGTGGDIVTKSYSQNDVLTTLSPAPSGEHVKSVQKEYDGLGRLTSACLVSSASGSASCGQNTSATGFLTKYTYNSVGRLLSVVENAQSGTTQTRSYTYDLVGRTLTETNPESGTTTYTYDLVPSACPTNPGSQQGNLVAKQDANGNSICYLYDALHRNTSITDSGPNSINNHKIFVYDSASLNGSAMANAEGRLVESFTCLDHGGVDDCPPDPTVAIVGEFFSYDQRGMLNSYYQNSPNSGGYYNLSATYWAGGSIETISGVGLPTLTYGGLDGEGRVKTVSASSGTNPVSAVTYNNGTYTTEPIGALLQVTLGTGDAQNFTFDKNTNRMLSYQASVGSTPVTITGSLIWNANGTLQQLNITDNYNSGDTQNCTYAYDDFIRAASVNCVNGSTNIWNQTFSYGSNSFGNIQKSTNSPGQSWNPGYNSANNRYTLAGTSYDADGNILNDTFHQYTWLPDGHVATIDSNTITYDASGNKVEESVAGTIHEYVSAFGVTAQMTGQTENATIVSLPGGVQALYSGGTLQRFRYTDWQGTTRAESSTSRAFTESLAFAPFGERYAVKGSPYNVDSFTGKPDQIVRDDYDFDARELHNPAGRWVSPDPVRGTGNKYVYAENDPLSKVDPYGLAVGMVATLFYGGDDVYDAEEGTTENTPGAPSESHEPSSAEGSACYVCNNYTDFQMSGGGTSPSSTTSAQTAQNQTNTQTQLPDNPKNLQLVPTSDDGKDKQSYRNVVYEVETKNGKQPNGTWYVTEHQTNTSVAEQDGVKGVSGGNEKNKFSDLIGCVACRNVESKQTFTISTSPGVKATSSFSIDVHSKAGDFGTLGIHIDSGGPRINGGLNWLTNPTGP